MSKDKTKGLAEARAKRSIEKRSAVEDAIIKLKERKEPVTFKAISFLANVSRQYLYNNFKDEISEVRKEDRAVSNLIDGITVPLRTQEEYMHVEALLRKKIESMKEELGKIRLENARFKQALERERGKTEHFRQNWINALSKTND